MTVVGYATALLWPWLNQICEPSRVARGEAASIGGLVIPLKSWSRLSLSETYALKYCRNVVEWNQCEVVHTERLR